MLRANNNSSVTLSAVPLPPLQRMYVPVHQFGFSSTPRPHPERERTAPDDLPHLLT